MKKEIQDKLNIIYNRNIMLFNMAISHLFEVGAEKVRELSDEEIEEIKEKIEEEQKGKHFIISADFQIEIIKTAREFSKFSAMEIACFYQNNRLPSFSNENSIGDLWRFYNKTISGIVLAETREEAIYNSKYYLQIQFNDIQENEDDVTVWKIENDDDFRDDFPYACAISY